jgi:hypothetical protein
MKAFKRFYRKEHVAEGVKTVAELQSRVMQEAPMSAGPLAALAPKPAPAGAEQPELAEAHCHGCGEKKTFQVEGTDTMKNGALRKYGKGVCGHKLSTFAPGEKATSGSSS